MSSLQEGDVKILRNLALSVAGLMIVTVALAMASYLST